MKSAGRTQIQIFLKGLLLAIISFILRFSYRFITDQFPTIREIASLGARLSAFNPDIFKGAPAGTFKLAALEPQPFELEEFDPDDDEGSQEPPPVLTQNDVVRKKMYSLGL